MKDRKEKKPEIYTGTITSFNDLEDEFFGKKGSVERDAYEAEYRMEVAKEAIGSILKMQEYKAKSVKLN